MKLYVMVKSHDRFGAHTTLTTVGRFLCGEAPALGQAISEMTVTLYLEDDGPPRPTLEPLLIRHISYRASLPKVTFFRTKGKVAIDVASKLMKAQEWKPSPRMSLPLFRRGVDEVIEAIAMIRPRLKADDDFDLAACLAHCEAARQRIPESEDALNEMGASLRAADKRAFEALSRWEQLDIDWAEFHPRARGLLDDPFFWESTDDFAPHGNDTGADVLAAYRTWLRRHPEGQPVRFLERLSAQWGYSASSPMDDDSHAEACIALAFADLKLRGHCDEQARSLALASLNFQRLQAESWTGPERQQRLIAIDRQNAVLSQLA